MKQFKCSMSKKKESLVKKQEAISGKYLMDPVQFEKDIREVIDGEYEKILKGCDDKERQYYELAWQLWDDCGYDYAGELYKKLQQQMYEYVSGSDYKMFGNFANIQWDWDDDHKDGIKFADLRKKLLGGVKDADTDEFSTWAIDWFFHAFGTYNMCYNFANDLGEEAATLEQEDEEERERENSDESKKNEKDARMSQPWGNNDLVATEDELARMDKEDPESAYLMRAMQYLRKDLRYVYDLNEEKYLIDRLLNLYDNGVDYKTAVRRIINNDNKLTNRLRLTPAESCKRSEKRTVQPPSYDVYTYDELSDEAKAKVKDLFLSWRGEGDNFFTENCKDALAELFPTSDLKVQYSLSYSQGDGFNTYGKLDVDDLLNVDLSKYPLKDSKYITPLSDKDAIKAVCEKADVTNIELPVNHPYNYSLANRIEVVPDYDVELTDKETWLLGELEKFAQDVMGKINSAFESDGYDYFYEMSEEEVRDMADANGYEFTEDGELA